ncbi:fatty acid desaturase [Pseudooceanicola sp.]|uniref:fatty acid desaturase n=1 Tax=Pseudooceanicola sp. TaxID=1914328 RepID=UPI002606590A|nr:fatty acid desaturase [Pseudooceanicola sp.]MDF1857014.1 fatty acid desaturase [Pseudooceanicola sp.]
MKDTIEDGKKSRSRISPQARRHMEMRRNAVSDHPELRKLTGTQPLTVLALPVILAVHWGMAWAVSDAPIWVIFIAAFFVGQIAIHAAGSLAHETAHKLIFSGDRAKLGFDIGLEWILSSYGKQLIYQYEHISSHHPYIGDYERDYEHEDICALQSRMMLRSENPRLQHLLTGFVLFIHLLPLGTIVGDALIGRVNKWASHRPQSDPDRHIGAMQPPKSQMRLFMVVSALSNITLLALFGPWALLYHLWALSLFLGKFGIWNLGQSLSEHQGTDEITPTRSYYGWLNWLLFNTGYHNEHHTFAGVPWTRLPELRRRAPEVFNHPVDKSYFGYWLDHVRGDFTASRENPMLEQDNSARCAGEASAAT